MQPVSPAPLHAPIAMLQKTPSILEILLRDLPAELLQWKPTPECWSITEVVGHMTAIERLYEQRARRMVVEDAPGLPPYVAPEQSELLNKSARQHLEEFAALRRAFVFYLQSIPSAAGSRGGRHHEMGMITLSQMLHELANHDLGHLRQIAELYRAHAFYPYAGPFQKYSNPKP
jgi:DinB family protein